jgi:hypothetical protein
MLARNGNKQQTQNRSTMVRPSRSPRLLFSNQPSSFACTTCRSLFLPIVYICVGFLLAKVLDVTTPSDALTRGLLDPLLVQTNGRDPQEREENDGWKTIQVYTGSSSLTVGPSEDLSIRYYSQARQDELVLALLRNQTNGYFIDLAANDAHLLSNTAALEHSFQWTGLCIEPNPVYWFNLSHYRPNCKAIAAVVGQTRNEKVYFRYDAGDHGGISDTGFDNGKRWQKYSQLAYTVPLLEIFQRNQVPAVIDYLSLDVEGAESFILMNFPLQRYKIKIITAERLRGPVRNYLQKHGYEFIKRLSSWGESLWVHSDYKHELDMEAVERFPFPIGAVSLSSATE